MVLSISLWKKRVLCLWHDWLNRHSFTIGSNNVLNNLGGIRIKTRIQISGNDNRIVIEKGSKLINTLIKISGSRNEVVLKAYSHLSGVELWIEDDQCKIIIGERTSVGHHSHLACTENGSELIVGDDGMISAHVQIRTGDSHSIIDNNGNRINYARSVIIGDHCWIGEGAKVMKGVILEGDDVISTGSIVTHSFGRNLLIGGVPARVLKERISWDSRRL